MGPHARRGSGGRVLFALLVSGVACTSDPGTSATPPPSPPPPFVKPATIGGWSTTAQLIHDPAIQKKVDALAALSLQQGLRLDPTAENGVSTGLVPTVTAKMIGNSGITREQWRVFADLEKSISLDDAKALLHHEDPVIRVYFAGHVARATPESSPNFLYPLLLDTTDVNVREGCSGVYESVAEAVLEDILDDDDGLGESLSRGRTDATHVEVMKTIVADDRISGNVRGKTLGVVADLDRDAAHPFAIVAAKSTDTDWRRRGIAVLGRLHDPADIPLFADQTKSADPTDRSTTANALGGIDDPAARDLLAPLVDDENAIVRANAASSYAAQTSATDAIMTKLLHGSDEECANAAAQGLAKRGNLHAFELLAPTLMTANPLLDTPQLEALIDGVGAPAIPITRDLLSSQSQTVTDVAVAKLGELGDTQSIPVLREFLRERQMNFIAATALGDLNATEATPDLVAALTDGNPTTRIAAANALVKIHAIDALPALEKAASTDDTFARSDLAKAAAELRAQ